MVLRDEKSPDVFKWFLESINELLCVFSLEFDELERRKDQNEEKNAIKLLLIEFI